MHELIKAELEAMQLAHDALSPLDESGQRRAIMWLAAKLDVDLAGYELPIAREAVSVAEAGLRGHQTS